MSALAPFLKNGNSNQIKYESECEKIKHALMIERETEIDRVRKRTEGFKYQNSKSWVGLCRRYGDRITHDELVSVAEVLNPYIGIKLDRDAKRRKNVMLKWFEDNWNTIEPWLSYVVLEDDPKIM